MLNTSGWMQFAAVLLSALLGAMVYRVWQVRVTLHQQRIPALWELRVRPMFTDGERKVWHWLRRVFFDHHVLLKVPVIRFLLPSTNAQKQHSHELLKGIYCSFTVCSSDGVVIGCIDLPGRAGLRASNRDLKKKLFSECGVAYMVLNLSQLPKLEVLRAAFLEEAEQEPLLGSEFSHSSQMPFSQPADIDALIRQPEAVARKLDVQVQSSPLAPIASQASSGPAPSQKIDMTTVASARSSLRSKLERNRQVRVAKIEELSAKMGIVDDRVDHNFVVPWDDSFLMEDTPGNLENRN